MDETGACPNTQGFPTKRTRLKPPSFFSWVNKIDAFQSPMVCRPQSDFESYLNIGVWFNKYFHRARNFT
ncbi:hypothetical protein HPP92_026600 [Vanilla planifolia]|uniref:Uncharacterized protein n=1 Tax=Vanilla planifolia TaxID=51239 RepID=A0A835PG85_VANPL|nr:hypothetical protein HPP92_026600 [Vanilla planifolia]